MFNIIRNIFFVFVVVFGFAGLATASSDNFLERNDASVLTQQLDLQQQDGLQSVQPSCSDEQSSEAGIASMSTMQEISPAACDGWCCSGSDTSCCSACKAQMLDTDAS